MLNKGNLHSSSLYCVLQYTVSVPGRRCSTELMALKCPQIKAYHYIQEMKKKAKGSIVICPE